MEKVAVPLTYLTVCRAIKTENGVRPLRQTCTQDSAFCHSQLTPRAGDIHISSIFTQGSAISNVEEIRWHPYVSQRVALQSHMAYHHLLRN